MNDRSTPPATAAGRNRSHLAQHADSLHRLTNARVNPGAHPRSADRLARYAVDGLLAAEILVSHLNDTLLPLAADAIRYGVPLHDVAFLLIWSDDHLVEALTAWAHDHDDAALLDLLGAGAVAA